MLRNIFLILLLIPFTAYSQQCYELNEGRGLSLFSPFLGNTPFGKPQLKGSQFGDIAHGQYCNDSPKKWVLGVYTFAEQSPIFASHSGTAIIYNTSSFGENNQPNDAIWVNGDSITTTYMGIFPSIHSGQYVYAGQKIGIVYKDIQNDNFGFGIRRAPAYNPIHKRGYLPIHRDTISECRCDVNPLWPEYFINPSSRFIDYGRVNEIMPEVSLSVIIEPGSIGRWSFDNGVTWLSGGEKINGLTFGYYKIIFKPEYGYASPPSIVIKTNSSNKDFVTTVKYIPDYTILKKPEAEILREADINRMNEAIALVADSLSDVINAGDKTTLLKNNIIDSLNQRFSKIEEIQKETFYFTRLFKYILPVLLLAMLFTIILLFQNTKIRRQKKYLENLQKEQHHRVHNSLALVSSLLNKYKDNISPEKLANIDNSLIAISTVHRQLYKGDDLEDISFQPVAEKIASSLLTQKELSGDVKTCIDTNIIIPQKKIYSFGINVQ
ncbi:MAG: histidine kinase dimerization/phosphoacceptor domain -containing protein [Niabella sp.]